LYQGLSDRNYALFGLLGPLTAFVFIGISIFLSQWFSWDNNALSDLGHSVSSDVAPLFNFGLLLSGFFTILYALVSFRKHAKYTSYFLMLSGLALQLVATFNEVYRPLHFQVSVLFFLSLCFVSICYIIEKKSILAVIALVVGLASWILYGLKVYSTGIAVPETVSSMAISAWIVQSALRTYLNK
jgi:hypothetical membrane protein